VSVRGTGVMGSGLSSLRSRSRVFPGVPDFAKL
jgi:hypothetical protein